jgi:hypothetical protein
MVWMSALGRSETIAPPMRTLDPLRSLATGRFASSELWSLQRLERGGLLLVRPLRRIAIPPQVANYL